MRKHIALFAVFVLAIAFFAGMYVYFSVSTFTFLESGEVTLGERSDAEGLEISSTVEIAGKYSFTGVYDPAAGVSAGTYDEWNLFPSGRGRGSFRVYASVFTASEDTDVPAYREIFLDYMENRSVAANETRIYRLNDFTDTVPLSADFGSLSAPGDEDPGYNAAITEALPVPLPGDVYLTVTYGGGLDLDSSYDTLDITSRCTSVLSEGWLYFVPPAARRGRLAARRRAARRLASPRRGLGRIPYALRGRHARPRGHRERAHPRPGLGRRQAGGELRRLARLPPHGAGLRRRAHGARRGARRYRAELHALYARGAGAALQRPPRHIHSLLPLRHGLLAV